MKAKLLAVAVAGLGLLLCTVPMLAHHSFAAEYDSAKPITLTGTVTNPSRVIRVHPVRFPMSGWRRHTC